MRGIPIDPKELVPMPSDEIEIGGTAYYLEDDGSYSSVTFQPTEMQNPERRQYMIRETKVRRNFGKMFLNRTAPWKRVKLL
jgi:hypothetical protein